MVLLNSELLRPTVFPLSHSFPSFEYHHGGRSSESILGHRWCERCCEDLGYRTVSPSLKPFHDGNGCSTYVSVGRIFRTSVLLRRLALLAEFTAHSDSITCIDFFDKDDRTFILTSSSDCSVVLFDIHGNAYGTFGQPNQWRVELDLSKANEEESQVAKNKDGENSEDESSKTLDNLSQIALSQDMDAWSTVTDEDMLTRRSNVWESTSIGNEVPMPERRETVWRLIVGVSFQEKRTNRRQRNQPSLITKKDFLLWEKTGLAPGGAYGVRWDPFPVSTDDGIHRFLSFQRPWIHSIHHPSLTRRSRPISIRTICGKVIH